MTENLSWIPRGINTELPSVARVYDFFLGGGHNFESDRRLAEVIQVKMPDVRDTVRVNRAFLRRAVNFLVEQGIRQFLDIGSGIPTVGNVHEIAQQAEPECRVVYVDMEPVAVAHGQLLLEDNDRAIAIQGDLRDPEGILEHAEVRGLLDFDRPIGLLNLLVWHFVTDEEDPAGLLARYRDAFVPGSYLAMSHATYDQDDDRLRGATEETAKGSQEQAWPRPYKEVVALFDGWELVEPGVVGCAAWHPQGPGDFSDSALSNVRVYAGVARKP
ncbi:hypothetical protein GCM10012275_50050 [Longimycelium tulufanense]|uniref:S-adenosyl methyltransferase n=1 Tax=Longimycelium tulufanense TaxID=907463 RepID=A0A8J3CIS1_9PSEU|nr:SAM-dependent methyltransferase [Longimycelium tulufanense]GGM73407.1 hypothetical protein GCM10012275_50050 [Longimycelium tulufanense]